MSFLKSYTIINRILFLSCLCPILPNRNKTKFQCKSIYLFYNIIATITYSIYAIIIMWINEMLHLFQHQQKSYVLMYAELFRISLICIAYQIAIILVTWNRYDMVKFLNDICGFDQQLLTTFHYKINYERLNRIFLIECLTWTIYNVMANILESIFLYRIRYVSEILWLVCYDIVAIGFRLILFHLKYCSDSLYVRMNVIIKLLKKNLDALNRPLNMKSKTLLFDELELCISLMNNLKVLKQQLNKTFGSVLCYSVNYDVVSSISLTYYLLSSIIHSSTSAKKQRDILDFFVTHVPIFFMYIYVFWYMERFGWQVSLFKRENSIKLISGLLLIIQEN